MADVRVDFTGNTRGFKKAVSEVISLYRRVGGAAKRASASIKGGFKSATGVITDYASGLTLIEQGFGALQQSAKNTFNTFEQDANRSLAAVRAALGDLSVEIGKVPELKFTDPQSLTEFGRQAQEQVRLLNEQLDDRGLGARLQANETILSGFAKTLTNVTALFSNQVRVSEAQTRALLAQREEAQEIVNFTQQQLELLRQQDKIRKAAGSAGAGIKALESPDVARPISPKSFAELEREERDKFALPDLPDRDSFVRLFDVDRDESIANATKSIRDFETAVKAGLVPSLEAMQGRTDLLRERLLTMIEQGVSPASVGFQQLQEQLRAAEAELQAVEASAFANEVAFTVFSDSAQEALEAIIFKTNSLNDALKNVGRRLLSTFLTAGVNVGIGAITGNPLSFGQALGTAVGIPVGASSAAPTADLSKATLSSSQLNSFGGAKVQVEATATRISGGDLLLTIQEAQNTRGTGGINIS